MIENKKEITEYIYFEEISPGKYEPYFSHSEISEFEPNTIYVKMTFKNEFDRKIILDSMFSGGK